MPLTTAATILYFGCSGKKANQCNYWNTAHFLQQRPTTVCSPTWAWSNSMLLNATPAQHCLESSNRPGSPPVQSVPKPTIATKDRERSTDADPHCNVKSNKFLINPKKYHIVRIKCTICRHQNSTDIVLNTCCRNCRDIHCTKVLQLNTTNLWFPNRKTGDYRKSVWDRSR